MSKVADVLLTPSETNAFSSFLSAMDNLDPNNPTSALNLSAEWQMYAATFASQVHRSETKEDLAKATKDLIGFGDAVTVPHVYHPLHDVSLVNPSSAFQPLSRPLSTSNGLSYPQGMLQDARSWPSIPSSSGSSQQHIDRNGLGVLIGTSAERRPSLVIPSNPLSRPTLTSLSPSTTFLPGSSFSPSYSTHPQSFATPESTSTSPVSFTPSSRKRPSGDFNHSNSEPVISTYDSNKRSKHSPTPSTSNALFLTNDAPLVAEPERLSRSASRSVSRPGPHTANSESSAFDKPRTAASTGSSSPPLPTPPPTNKMGLLSAEQKKLNHIYSEQKRRANIRRGYDALCDVVPALRDAILAEDAACATTGKKRGRGRLLGEDGEKLDGRAGPRSESVVLQKTIEYMTDLLDKRQELLERLQAARSVLPPGHPALILTSSERPWERIWNGGVGLPLNGDSYDPDGDDDDAGSEGED